MKISVVIPAYNEAAGIEQFHKRLLLPALQDLDIESEIVYVDDGSHDGTLAIISEIGKSDKNVRVVALSRNFGKEIAVTAGIAASSGNATIILDADGQHPPSLIGSFVDEWKKGAQVVIGVRENVPDYSRLKRLGSRFYNKTFNSIIGSKAIANTTDFRLIDKDVREEFLKLTEQNRITRGLIDWLGFRRAYITFDAPERIAGKPTYSIHKLMQLAFHSITSLSIRPLLWLMWSGIVVTVSAFLLGGFLLIEQILMHDPMGLDFTGTALLSIFISFLIGIVLTSEGILGLYVANVQEQTRGRPLYVVNHKYSVNLEKNL